MTPAAFQAEFVNVKNVPSRKTVQFVFEVPVEMSSGPLDALGGIPHPGVSVRVAIARLDVAKVEKPKERTASQRAWALCQSGRFRAWLTERWSIVPDLVDEAHCADALRLCLNIKSRGELDTNPDARARFETLEREYQESTR